MHKGGSNIVLNNYSHVHVRIRQYCLQLELLSGMKLVTDLSTEFNEIRLVNTLGYILINYKKSACFTLSHKLSKKEFDTVQDIILYCNWLEEGNRIMRKMARNRGRKRG